MVSAVIATVFEIDIPTCSVCDGGRESFRRFGGVAIGHARLCWQCAIEISFVVTGSDVPALERRGLYEVEP